MLLSSTMRTWIWRWKAPLAIGDASAGIDVVPGAIETFIFGGISGKYPGDVTGTGRFSNAESNRSKHRSRTIANLYGPQLHKTISVTDPKEKLKD
jgi:hypothetical protein